ncbi:nitronate monooxygenase [Parasulfuritortus cantonensis]|uniref:nitronate monooxygenase n=1 Tax=Parasulfuritortus cantonensis TaxID=2528202 RepID=UPI001F0FC671|nr:nitronate monooxygenase [Parasulfuritortus cantonensis]
MESTGFRDAKIGIIVSSPARAAVVPAQERPHRPLPDYVVVEVARRRPPRFRLDDWNKHDLATINAEILAWLRAEQLDIPIISAGGIFTGSDATPFPGRRLGAVQSPPRFTVTDECGLPDEVKQEYFKANEEDIEVNGISPTGYPMRMLRGSPGIGATTRPNCEAYGYILDSNGHCAYIDA